MRVSFIGLTGFIRFIRFIRFIGFIMFILFIGFIGCWGSWVWHIDVPTRNVFPGVICLKPAYWKFNIDLLKCYRDINAIFDTDVFTFFENLLSKWKIDCPEIGIGQKSCNNCPKSLKIDRKSIGIHQKGFQTVSKIVSWGFRTRGIRIWPQNCRIPPIWVSKIDFSIFKFSPKKM